MNDRRKSYENLSKAELVDRLIEIEGGLDSRAYAAAVAHALQKIPAPMGGKFSAANNTALMDKMRNTMHAYGAVYLDKE